jgi:hypothetical protein
LQTVEPPPGVRTSFTGPPHDTPPTWPPVDPPPIPEAMGNGVWAATSHLTLDKFYAATNDGKTWIQEAEGSLAMIEGASLPDGAVPAPGGMYRDGSVPDIVYIATTLGLYKTIDGFRTPEAYYKLREPL